MTRRRSENSYLIVENYTFRQLKDLKYRGTYFEYIPTHNNTYSEI